jgi:DNA-binding NarL/FixJ family response regulator
MSPEQAAEYALSEERAVSPTAPSPDRPPAGEPTAKLSRREKGVAELLARGLTNRRIAEELFLSERTVENHVRNILKKLNLSSRSEVAAWVEAQLS